MWIVFLMGKYLINNKKSNIKFTLTKKSKWSLNCKEYPVITLDWQANKMPTVDIASAVNWWSGAMIPNLDDQILNSLINVKIKIEIMNG